MAFQRQFGLFGVAALLFSCGVASSTHAAKPAQAIPTPGTYGVDPVHSFAYFGALHHVVGLVRSRFDKVTGTITVSQDLAACGIDIAIDIASVSTQNTERDEDLRSPDFFDVGKFPTMAYHGRGMRRVAGSWLLDGSLKIRGVTRVVPLEFTFNGCFPDTPPGKPARVAFSWLRGGKARRFRHDTRQFDGTRRIPGRAGRRDRNRRGSGRKRSRSAEVNGHAWSTKGRLRRRFSNEGEEIG